MRDDAVSSGHTAHPTPLPTAHPTIASSSQSFLRLIVAQTLIHASLSGTRLAIMLEATSLHVNQATIGLMVSLVMLVPAFAAVAAGRWADRVGYLRPTLCGVAMLASGAILAATTASIPLMCIVCVLIGSGYILGFIGINNFLGRSVSPETRIRVFGAAALGISASAVMGPAFAGAAVDQVGYSSAFALLLIFPCIAALLLLRAPTAAAPAAAAARAPSAGKGGLLAIPRLRAVLILSSLMSVSWDMFNFVVPLHGVSHALSATQVGLVAASFGGGSFVVRLALPSLVRNLGEWRVLQAAFGVAALGFIAFPFCVSFLPMVAMALPLGIALGIGQPLVMSLLHVAAPRERTGEAVGIRMALTSTTQTVLPLVFGALGSTFGNTPLFLTVATLMATGNVLTGRERKRPGADGA